MRRCRHTWETVGQEYTPPASAKVGKASEQFFEKLAFGLTTVTLRCSDCGDVSFRSTPGRVAGITTERPAWKEERDRLMREGKWGTVTG